MTRELIIISKTHGTFTVLVDDNMYEDVIQYKWHVNKQRKGFYVARNIRTNEKHTLQFLHQYIIQLSGLYVESCIIDHKNGNRLDNRRENLRIVTQRQNAQNNKANTSGYAGVSYHKPSGKYQTNIWVDGNCKHLGLFTTPQEAYAEYYLYCVLTLGIIPIPLNTHQNTINKTA